MCVEIGTRSSAGVPVGRQEIAIECVSRGGCYESLASECRVFSARDSQERYLFATTARQAHHVLMHFQTRYDTQRTCHDTSLDDVEDLEGIHKLTSHSLSTILLTSLPAEIGLGYA